MPKRLFRFRVVPPGLANAGRQTGRLESLAQPAKIPEQYLVKPQRTIADPAEHRGVM